MNDSKDNAEYQSTKFSFALINWARDGKSQKKLNADLKTAYKHIEKEHIDVNLKEDLPRFFHQFTAALYVKDLALDLIDSGFPVIDLFKKYNDHLVWTRDKDLSQYVQKKDTDFYELSLAKAMTATVPSDFWQIDSKQLKKLSNDINVYLQADVFNVIASNMEQDRKNQENKVRNNHAI